LQAAIAVRSGITRETRHVPLTANLLAWLKVPAEAHGPVVTKAARRKLDALLLKLKVPLHALRTTWLLCWLALHGAEQTELQAGVSQTLQPDPLPKLVSRAEAQGFFGLAPD
jgi:integrase